MILEVAILNIIPEKTVEFEASFEISQSIISSMKGYRGHQLQKCLETPDDIFCSLTGKSWKIIPSDSGNHRNISNGKTSCITSIFLFPSSNTIH